MFRSLPRKTLLVKGKAVTGPLLVLASDKFGMPMKAFDFENLDEPTLVDLSRLQVPSEVLTQIAAYASCAGDDLLLKQASAFGRFCSLTSRAAACGIWVNSVLQSQSAERTMSLDSVKMLSSVRREIADTDQSNAMLLKELEMGVGSHQIHCTALDKLIIQEEFVTLLGRARALVGKIVKRWLADLNAIHSALEEACPNWAPFRNDMLLRPDIIQSLLDNVDKHYIKIGPLVKELRDHLKLVKVLHGDGAGVILQPTDYKNKKEMCQFGVGTVAFTFLAYQVVLEIPKIQNLKLIEEKVTWVRKRIESEHNVTLTEQMDALLKALASGNPTYLLLTPPGSEQVPTQVPTPTEPAADPSPPAAPPSESASPQRGRKRKALAAFM